MKIKLSLVLVVIFLLVLTNCSLFDDYNLINLKEPQEGDVLVRGESFMVVTDFDVDEEISKINVELFLETYDTVLWEYDLFDEDVNFKGECQIEKKLTVPSDAPGYCFLQVNYFYKWDKASGYANAVMVSVVDPED